MIVTLVAAGAIVGALLTAGGHASAQTPAPLAVDLELVIASDVSTSMSRDEKRLQLGGFVAAFRDRDVVGAIMRGRRGRIAVTYVEWGGEGRQRIIVPWTLVDGTSSAGAFAQRLQETAPGRLTFGTSMGDALAFCADLFGSAAFRGDRRVIDISGDGVSNRGRPLPLVRADVLRRGITINGLPIVYDRTQTASLDDGYSPEEITSYFAVEVIGGADAFVFPVHAVEEFPEAVRQKLIREIAGAAPGTRRFSALP